MKTDIQSDLLLNCKFDCLDQEFEWLLEFIIPRLPLVPKKWGFWEPLKYTVTTDSAKVIASQIGNSYGTVQFNGLGGFSMLFFERGAGAENHITITSDLRPIASSASSCIRSIMQLLTESTIELRSIAGKCHKLTENDVEIAIASGLIADIEPPDGNFCLGPSTIRQLVHAIPDVYCLNIWGTELISRFDAHRLESLSCYRNELLPSGVRIIQLAENPYDFSLDPKAARKEQDRVREYLGLEHFVTV